MKYKISSRDKETHSVHVEGRVGKAHIRGETVYIDKSATPEEFNAGCVAARQSFNHKLAVAARLTDIPGAGQ